MVNIRLVHTDDLSSLAEIYKEIYNELNIGEKWDINTAKQLMAHLYKEQSDLFFVAEVEGKVVGGIVALIKPWWDGNHLTDGELFISAINQKQGVGSLLLKHLLTAALEKYQAVSWDLLTHRVYEHPLKWYRSIGFKEIEQWVMINGNVKEVLNKLK